ncbi:MAG: DUF4147 domain-containing protein [Firmicutes bacterium]|nr:DUF4147 domain-containing protein [Bacillota bacterium]
MAKIIPRVRPSPEGWGEGRRLLLELLSVALEASDPHDAVLALVRREGDRVTLGPDEIPPGRRLHFIGAGKATAPIAEAAEEALGPRLSGGLVVLKRGQTIVSRRLEIRYADHPVPSDASAAAGLAMLRYLQQGVEPGDVVIAGFTGGSSALVSVPPPTVPWEAKVALHRVLLASGAPIEEINAVRKHVSRIKGGRLAALRPDVTFYNITVSDVAGDALDLITDPTVVDSSTYEDAIAVLQARGLWNTVHPAIRRHLESAPDPVLDLPQVRRSWVVASGASVANAVQRYVAQRHPDWPCCVFSTTLSGEAREVGRVLAAYARERARRGQRLIAVMAGGETTVTLPASHLGQGGPNQELAFSFAREIRGYSRIALASIDSDGEDGSTPLAGALVDGMTAKEVRTVEEALRSHHTLKLAQVQGGIDTGQTRTNVNDITLLIVG